MKLTQENIESLSEKVDGFVELEMGRRLPFVCALVTDEGHIGLFTNRRSNLEVIDILEECLKAARTMPQSFKDLR